jgi:hypothetical protein
MPIEDEIGPEPEDRLPNATDGDWPLIHAVTSHFESIYGKVEKVYHEQESRFVHVDLHRFPPESEDGYHTIVTTGMAERPMNVPAEVEDPENYRYAELVLHLPGDWPMNWEDLSEPENWWPLGAMQSIARLPHERESWVWGGHTLRHAGDFSPYTENTDLSAALICPSYLLPEGAEVLKLADGRKIVFLTLAFIYKEEFDYCVKHHSDAFLDHVADSGLSPLDFFVLDERRPNTCA